MLTYKSCTNSTLPFVLISSHYRGVAEIRVQAALRKASRMAEVNPTALSQSHTGNL